MMMYMDAYASSQETWGDSNGYKPGREGMRDFKVSRRISVLNHLKELWLKASSN
jgi:hypothetical protein